jgi:uncharacterized protein YunC (DUF1805 family)
MHQEKIRLQNSNGIGYVVPLGPVNLVWVIAVNGIVGCGAFDVEALQKFSYPAARVRPIGGTSIETLEDLLTGEIKDANQAATQFGVSIGMRGKDALDRLS